MPHQLAPTQTYWNHANYTVPPENVPLIEKCFATLLPWEQFIKREGFLGYRLQKDNRMGGIYIFAADEATMFERAIARLRKTDKELDASIEKLSLRDANVADHFGFMMPSLAEWKRRLDLMERSEKEHPDWKVKVLKVRRPGDPDSAAAGDIFEAFVRFGLLGPMRNVLEMQGLINT